MTMLVNKSLLKRARRKRKVATIHIAVKGASIRNLHMGDVSYVLKSECASCNVFYCSE